MPGLPEIRFKPITIMEGGEEKTLDPMVFLRIDPSIIKDELANQPTFHGYWGTLTAHYKKRAGLAEAAMKKKGAELYLMFKTQNENMQLQAAGLPKGAPKPPKYTEDHLKNLIQGDEEYQRLRESFIQLDGTYEELRAIAMAMYGRYESLGELSRFERGELNYINRTGNVADTQIPSKE